MTSIREEISFAIKKAIATGRLRTGDKLSSIRAMSRQMNVNPNTVHQAIATLVSEGVLIAVNAVGIFVAGPNPLRENHAGAFGRSVEKLVVDAVNFGFSERDLQKLVSVRWNGLVGSISNTSRKRHGRYLYPIFGAIRATATTSNRAIT